MDTNTRGRPAVSLLLTSVAFFMVALDALVVITALPAIHAQLGGSLVTEPGTFELLLASCLTVWVRAKPTEHMLDMLASMDRHGFGPTSGPYAELLASDHDVKAFVDATLISTSRPSEVCRTPWALAARSLLRRFWL